MFKSTEQHFHVVCFPSLHANFGRDTTYWVVNPVITHNYLHAHISPPSGEQVVVHRFFLEPLTPPLRKVLNVVSKLYYTKQCEYI
mmetsp:Transcript_50616/g.90442  ORF Transcript_50616/g.90442 Transcript_50616/m.90442 type:complete len:85 (-) Transcript_50616:74-328(-)